MEIKTDSFLNIIRTKKNRCATDEYFNGKCYVDDNPHAFLKMQLRECVQKWQ